MKLLLLFFRIGLNIKGNIKTSGTSPHARLLCADMCLQMVRTPLINAVDSITQIEYGNVFCL